MKITKFFLICLLLPVLGGCGKSSKKSPPPPPNQMPDIDTVLTFDQQVEIEQAVYPPEVNEPGSCKQLHLGMTKTPFTHNIVQSFTPDGKNFLIVGFPNTRVVNLKDHKIQSLKGISYLHYLDFIFDKNDSFMAVPGENYTSYEKRVSIDLKDGSITKVIDPWRRIYLSRSKVVNDGKTWLNYPDLIDPGTLERTKLTESLVVYHQKHVSVLSQNGENIFFVTDSKIDPNSVDYETHIYRYNFITGERVKLTTVLGQFGVNAIVHLEHESRELLAFDKGNYLYVYDLQSNTVISRKRSYFRSLEQLPDGKRFLATYLSGSASVAEIHDPFLDTVTPIKFTNDPEYMSAKNRFFITKADKNRYTVHNLETAEEVCHFKAKFIDYIMRDDFEEIVALSPDGKSFGFHDVDGNFRIIKFDRN